MNSGHDNCSVHPLQNSTIELSAHELQPHCFQNGFSLTSKLLPQVWSTDDITLPTVASVGSIVQMSEASEDQAQANYVSLYHVPLSFEQLNVLSEEANSTVLDKCEARQGIENQRWAVDPKNGHCLRLIAGCVPILSDGRVLLVSSSKGNGWLLPKGGWELDECLEEAAIRECYEEAGVLGIIGLKIDSVCLEAKKARKRRLEREEKVRRQPEFCQSFETEIHSGWSVLSQLSEEDHLIDEEPTRPFRSLSSSHRTRTSSESMSIPAAQKKGVHVTIQIAPDSSSNEDKSHPIPMHCDLNSLVSAKKHVLTPDGMDDSGSAALLTHTHVCMSFFPLYIQTIHQVWPEDKRSRQAFPIDEALKIIRPEFCPILEQVKAEGLHLVGTRVAC